MDGLECSEISFLKAITSSYSSRLDSDFFKKDALELSAISENWDVLSAICPEIKSGTTPAMRDKNLKDGIALLKTNDIRNNIVSPLSAEQFFYIDEQTDKKMKSSSVNDKDVLINIVGATTDVIGRVAFVPEGFIRSNITQAMAILRIKNTEYLPEYLFVFLLGDYAKRQTNRIARQTGQYNMNLTEVGTYRIWKPSMAFQLAIATIIRAANSYQINGQKLYQEGQNIASRLLSIHNDILSQIFSIKAFSETLSSVGRLDAEYYQAKYDAYDQAIKQYANGFTTVKSEFELVTEKCLRNLSQYQYVEIGDINIGDGSYTFSVLKTQELPDNAKIMTHAGDILVSTVRPNRGAVAILEENNLLVSSAFTVLRPKFRYSKETLQVLLRTPIYRDWLLKFNVGTSYPVIKDIDVLNLPIPIFEDYIQKEITGKVQESSRLRKSAKQLLTNAVKAVEMAIEQGEDVALAWLKDKVE